jgi:hypothetical protein
MSVSDIFPWRIITHYKTIRWWRIRLQASALRLQVQQKQQELRTVPASSSAAASPEA